MLQKAQGCLYEPGKCSLVRLWPSHEPKDEPNQEACLQTKLVHSLTNPIETLKGLQKTVQKTVVRWGGTPFKL